MKTPLWDMIDSAETDSWEDCKKSLYGRIKLWWLWITKSVKIEHVFTADAVFYIPHFNAEQVLIAVDTSRLEERVIVIEEWMTDKDMVIDGMQLNDGEVYMWEDGLVIQKTIWKKRLFKEPEMIDSAWIF